MVDDLIDVLEARRGIVCAIGAGGKKTTLQRLARAHGGRCALTTTVPMAPLPNDFPGTALTAGAEQLEAAVIAAAGKHRLVGYAQAFAKPGRWGGVPMEMVARIHREGGFDTTLVKADGARMRGIKAPAEHEPNLPPGTTTVLYLVSVRVVGQPLGDNSAHRPERLTTVTGAVPGEALTTDHLARLLVSPDGALKGIGGTRFIPVINQADDEAALKKARRIAEMTLAASPPFDRVVIAAMNRPRPIVDVIRS